MYLVEVYRRYHGELAGAIVDNLGVKLCYTPIPVGGVHLAAKRVLERFGICSMVDE
jgi:hypothetical protein